jgi:hypothetical protein
MTESIIKETKSFILARKRVEEFCEIDERYVYSIMHYLYLKQNDKNVLLECFVLESKARKLISDMEFSRVNNIESYKLYKKYSYKNLFQRNTTQYDLNLLKSLTKCEKNSDILKTLIDFFYKHHID